MGSSDVEEVRNITGKTDRQIGGVRVVEEVKKMGRKKDKTDR